MNFLYYLAVEAPAEASSDGLLGLAQYGAVGIMLIILIVYARSQINREKERTDRAEKKADELENYIRSEFLPKQERSNYLHNQTADILEKALMQLAARDEADRKAREAENDARIRDEIRREMERDKRDGKS